jgi:hypothetical protein
VILAIVISHALFLEDFVPGCLYGNPGGAKTRFDIPDERIGFIIFAHVMLIGGALALLFMAMR